jgi:selenocysteine-specific elongation factor
MGAAQRKDLVAAVLEFAQQQGYSTFNAGTFVNISGGAFDDREVAKVLDRLYVEKKLIKLNDGRFLSTNAMREIKERVVELIHKKGSISIHDCREALGFGRMRAIPILDYLDSMGLTRRAGDVRILAIIGDHSD